jgi:hypothetical protein
MLAGAAGSLTTTVDTHEKRFSPTRSSSHDDCLGFLRRSTQFTLFAQQQLVPIPTTNN